MAAEQRKLLEQLMGAEALESIPTRQKIDLYDPKVCHSFTVGLCPHDLFVGMRFEKATCNKLHLEQHRMEYELLIEQGRTLTPLEKEYERELAKYVVECDRRIEEGQLKLEATHDEVNQIRELTEKLETLDASIAMSVEEIKLLGEMGEISRGLAEMQQLESKRAERALRERDLAKMMTVAGFSGHQKLQVCPPCGAYLSRLDTDRRLADHFLGKMHLNYVTIRKEYARIKQKLRETGRR